MERKAKLVHWVGAVYDRERPIFLTRNFSDRFQPGARFGGCNNRNARLDDARLFKSDFGDGLPQPFLMIELNVGDDAGDGGDNISRIQPSAHSGFPDHQLASLLGEISKGHYCDDFEKRGMRFCRKLGDPSLRLLNEPNDFRFRDGNSIYLDTFVEPDQMRRSK